MTAYVMVEGKYSDGSPYPTEVHKWYNKRDADDVRQTYKSLYPDKVWEGDTMFRDKYIHSWGHSRVAHVKTTFHDEHPRKEDT